MASRLTMDARLLVHSFDYSEYTGRDRYNQPTYAAKQTINNCRIDNTLVYARDGVTTTVTATAIIFCYAGLTSPWKDFKEQSKVEFQGKSSIINRVVPVSHIDSSDLFAYELEVV